jgi:hypothetical protein
MYSGLQMDASKGRFVGRGYSPARADANISRCRVIQRSVLKASVLFEANSECFAASQTEGQSIKNPEKIGAGPGAGTSIVQILITIPFTLPLKMGILAS